MYGLFQLVKSDASPSKTDNYKIIGTAFAIQTLHDSSCEYYLLTAYHNISESFAKSEEVIIRDSNQSFHSVEIVYPTIFQSFSGSSISNDFALLKLITDAEYDRYVIGQIVPPRKCYIRGAANYFSGITQMTPFQGEMLSCEYETRFPDEKVIVLDVETKPIFDEQKSIPIDQQDVIEGLSGSPVIVIQDQKEVVAGVFVRLYHDGSASKCYGVPVSAIIEKCLLPRGLYSNIRMDEGEKTGQELSLGYPQSVELYIDLLFDAPEVFSLEDYQQETAIWDKISNQFYHGFAVDTIFYRAIESDWFGYYSYDTQATIRYYLAKFLFKRGRPRAAYEQFTQILKITKYLSANVSKRMEILLTARGTVEAEIKQPQFELDQIRQCRDQIGNLREVDEIYISNEIASVMGKGLTNLFGQLQKQDYSDSIKYAIKDIFNEHSNLLRKYPVPLQKQDVVNTSLSWLTNLWGIGETTDQEKLTRDVSIGFQQAVKRRNAIFHIQSMIAYSISLLIVEEKKRALTGLFVVALLMREKGLKTTHEGIAQLLRYINVSYHSFFVFFQLYLECFDKDEKIFLEKSSLYSIGITPIGIGALLQRAHYIMDKIYQPLGADTFLADMENVVGLL